MFEIPASEALDIDEEIDWQIVAGLMAGRGS
jgi:CMP-N-acetylneuraminic acid synthetase